jgi:methyl-accepting chemotaxis protein
MGQLTKATQQNASASEELAATSEELSAQAKQLQDSIAFFNVGAEAPNPPTGRRATPPRMASSITTVAVRSDRANNFRRY